MNTTGKPKQEDLQELFGKTIAKIEVSDWNVWIEFTDESFFHIQIEPGAETFLFYNPSKYNPIKDAKVLGRINDPEEYLENNK